MIFSPFAKSSLPYFTGAILALLATSSPSRAALTYTLFQQGDDVVLETSGSLTLPSVTISSLSCSSGALVSSPPSLCTGPAGVSMDGYAISGSTTFGGTAAIAGAPTVSGVSTRLNAEGALTGFYIDPVYVSGTPIISSATFENETLAALGFTTDGEIGSWSLLDGMTTVDTIRLVVNLSSQQPQASVPGPLPLMGAAAAFGWSRRLRRDLHRRSKQS
jgi:hypothetical protein